jgi:hypothetical protein
MPSMLANQNLEDRSTEFLRSHVDKVLLLSLQLNGFLHSTFLKVFGPFLLADICNTAENTLQLSITMSLRVGTHENPCVASTPISVLPGGFESEFICDCSLLIDERLPDSFHSLAVFVFNAIHPAINTVFGSGMS